MDDTHAMKVKVWDASFRVDDVPDHVESDVFQKVPVEDGVILVLDYMVARISMEFSLAWFGRCQTRRMGVNNE